MRFSTTVAVLLPASAAAARNIWPVSVGGPASAGGAHNLSYTPNQLPAASGSRLQVTPGDIILFAFEAANHSVTQSSFSDPCSPLAGGFDSGFQDATDRIQLVHYTVPENTTGPLWFYCAQTNPVVHCQEGMVFAINPTANKTFATFQQTAMGANTTNTNSSSSVSASASSTSGTGSVSSLSSTSSSGTGTVTKASTSTASIPTTLTGTSAVSTVSASSTPSSSNSSSNTSSSAPATTSSSAAMSTGAGPAGAAGVLLSGLGFFVAAIL